MTPKQRELARHALGLPNEQKCSYRNRYIVSVAVSAYAEWVEMARADEALRIWWEGGAKDRVLFMLTYEGALLALDGGEKLDIEDFPSETTGDD